MRHVLPAAAAATLVLAAPAARAQVTTTDYARAEAFLPWNAQTLVSGNEVTPRWLDGDRFWFRGRRGDGHEFVLVDPARGTRAPAFDHDRLAAALSLAADTAYVGRKLPFSEFDFVQDGRAIQFQVTDSLRWTCSLASYVCTGPDSAAARPRHETRSPDGRWVAFERDENLWVRSIETGQETQLSTDGERDRGYAVVPEGCCQEITNRRRKLRPAPVLKWSPDSRRIATHRYDERAVEQLHLLEAATGRPKLHSYRYALPGDSLIPTFDVHVFDVSARRGVRARIDAQPGFFTAADSVFPEVQWTRDGAALFVTRRSRDFKRYELHRVDPADGAARQVLTEAGRTYRELNQFPYRGGPNWRPLRNGAEVLWWSERDGWGHLYRYDAVSGAVLNQVTSGPWLVLEVLHVDESLGWVYFTGVGREDGVDPYYQQLYRVRLDGTGLTRLTPENADHSVWASPSGRHFLDLYSRRDTVPHAVIRAPDGRVLQSVERGDATRLYAAGWKPPVAYRAKARDGVTDVWGVIWKPSRFDSTRSYPVIDHIYPGPLISPAIKDFFPSREPFTYSGTGQVQALAELGFVVVSIDALGNTARGKALYTTWYGRMNDHGLPDHLAAIRQLATRMPRLDLTRVGIYGHSGGGFASTGALLQYPDFYRVAVSTAGNHDNRTYYHGWGERFQGLLARDTVAGTDNYAAAANKTYAGQLTGKLFLMHGDLDDNVHPAHTIALVDALVKANRSFDLLVLPDADHDLTGHPYVIRRTWDYFVEHLMGKTPPADYAIRRPVP